MQIKDWSQYQSYAIVNRLAMDNETGIEEMNVQQFATFIDE